MTKNNNFYIDEKGCHAEVTHLCHNRCGQIKDVKGQNVSRLCSYRLSLRYGLIVVKAIVRHHSVKTSRYKLTTTEEDH